MTVDVSFFFLVLSKSVDLTSFSNQSRPHECMETHIEERGRHFQGPAQPILLLDDDVQPLTMSEYIILSFHIST